MPSLGSNRISEAMSQRKTDHCGTLSYTKVGLLWLFVWLLWADFCFTVMQTVVPSVLPIKLKVLGASDLTIMLVATTLPSLLNMTICPYVSFKSDRFRSKWGRRIPFILFTLPFLVLSLICLGCGEDIASTLQVHIAALAASAPATTAIFVLGGFMVAYVFFDMFVGSVFWYIFNDVVPPGFLGRFVGCFRIVGGLAAALYNYFVFRYAENHMREIFIGAALLYFVGIGMMCFMVKEGEYPPVSEDAQRGSRGFDGVKTFFMESFSLKFYWTKYLINMFGSVSAVVSAFMVFFYKDMGLTMDEIGKAAGIMMLASMAAMYFAAIFVDRWHPLRIMMYSSVFAVIFNLISWVWLFAELPPRLFFWLYVMGSGVIGAFHNQLYGASTLPLDMRLHPKSRFGQFCSAQALVRSCGAMFAGLIAGAVFDFLKGFFATPDFVYRLCFAWVSLSWMLLAFFAIWLYLQWQRLGGDFRFHPPVPWLPEGVEEQEQTPYVGPQTRWLKAAFSVIDILMLLSALYFLVALAWMALIGWRNAVLWHFALLLPWSLALCAIWTGMEAGILSDISRCLAGKQPLNGIPHHGVLLVKVAALILMQCVWMALGFSAIYLGIERAVTVFGIGSLTMNSLLLLAIALFRRIERGHPQMLDYDGRKAA